MSGVSVRKNPFLGMNGMVCVGTGSGCVGMKGSGACPAGDAIPHQGKLFESGS